MSKTLDGRKIVWEEPPAIREQRDYSWFYEQLKDSPGKWARYPGTQAGASNWCIGHPSFEYTSKGDKDGNRKVWMRYKPSPGDPHA